MDRFNLKGDDYKTMKPERLEVIYDAIKKRGYSPAAEVLIEPLGKAGDNYMSNVKRIQVSENGHNTYMVAKFGAEVEMMKGVANTTDFFVNEHVLYTELFPKFRDLQKSADVPPEDIFQFPECYGTSLTPSNEAILLEDLSKNNYKMMDKTKPLTEKFVKIALKQFAIFHSLSYVLKHREPETFATISSKLVDYQINPIANSEQAKMMSAQVEKFFQDSMKEDKYRKLLKNTVSDLFHQTLKLSKSAVGSKHSVIQQGDGWTNNILFQLEEDKPMRCCLIDYQNGKENNPTWDLIFFLLMSITHEQRLKHFHEFLAHYHKELDKSLNYFGLKAAQIYPRDQLDADLKRYGKNVLSTAIFVTSFLVRDPENAGKVQENLQNTTKENGHNLVNEMAYDNHDNLRLFREKVEGYIDSLLEFGLIQKNAI